MGLSFGHGFKNSRACPHPKKHGIRQHTPGAGGEPSLQQFARNGLIREAYLYQNDATQVV